MSYLFIWWLSCICVAFSFSGLRFVLTRSIQTSYHVWLRPFLPACCLAHLPHTDKEADSYFVLWSVYNNIDQVLRVCSNFLLISSSKDSYFCCCPLYSLLSGRNNGSRTTTRYPVGLTTLTYTIARRVRAKYRNTCQWWSKVWSSLLLIVVIWILLSHRN